MIMNASNVGDLALTEPETISEEDSVGLAWLADDGTMVLQLKVLMEGGRQDQIFVELEPTDPRFAKVLAHLGGLRYGENKHIKPFEEGLLS